jgi:2-hydroxy-4-carboxymuconate semialdehyde hemiacetal dehydrogenase
MVCHTQRYYAPLAEVRARVERGDLRLHHVVSRTAFLRRENVGWTGRRRSWVDSVVWHHGSHAVDTALFLLEDEVAEVRAVAGRPHPETGQPMDISVALRTRSGALASLVLSYNSHLGVTDYLLIGEEDTFRLEHGVLTSPAGVVSDGRGVDDMQSAAILAQNRVFVDGVRDGRATTPSADDVLATYRVLQEVDAQLSR